MRTREPRTIYYMMDSVGLVATRAYKPIGHTFIDHLNSLLNVSDIIQPRRRTLTQNQQPELCNLNCRAGDVKAAARLYLRNELEFFMRFSPTGRGGNPSTFLVVPLVSYNYRPRPQKFKMAAYRQDVAMISRYEWDISKLSGKSPFLRSRNTVGLVWTLSHVKVSNLSKMTACNRKWIWNNVYLSLYIHDSNEIPTAMPMFSMSSNTTGMI